MPGRRSIRKSAPTRFWGSPSCGSGPRRSPSGPYPGPDRAPSWAIDRVRTYVTSREMSAGEALGDAGT